ncbi:MAG TPA: glycoside hydrolase family 1 protein [Acidimicrobiia bacterium]|nr:glycoside hydrolase family 1 protein [Acidimicrobiia bacterium]
MSTIFPRGFFWGTATAAHQVEGGNWNNDWWAWEHDPSSPCVEPSGDAVDHYHRYREDLGLLADLGFNTYRFSLEWSRLEPEDGEFSLAALNHYRRVAEACREFGLIPVVTFHHFTTPRWVAPRGGWGAPETADRFARFAGWAAAGLSGLLSMACTINEPNIVSTMGFLTGVFPPGLQDSDARVRANDVLIDAHHKASDAIRQTAPDCQVGLTLAMSEWTAVDGGESVVDELRGPMEDVFLAAVREDDFIGVQTYSRNRISPAGYLGPDPDAELTLMGYEFRPQALEATIRRAAEVTGIPVFVTENGIAANDDRRRIEFVKGALEGVHRCIEDGIDVLGYTYWSALDNFEWALGYGPKFGLIGVDRQTQQRSVKPSARWLGNVARANSIE